MTKILYKYLPIERMSYFENELLRFTQPADLNDPFECYPREIDRTKLFETIEKKVIPFTVADGKPDEIKKLKDKISIIVDDFLPKAYNKTNELTGILSLSKNWNNGLMWAHYTTSHKGFCVGFDKNHSFFNDILDEENQKSTHTKDVVYSKNRAEINVETPFVKPGFEIFITKSKDWEYEQEVRVISTLNRSDSVIKNDPLDIHLFKVPHNAIKEIVIGAKIEKEHKIKISEFCNKNDIKIFQSKISELSFDMEREEITAANNV